MREGLNGGGEGDEVLRGKEEGGEGVGCKAGGSGGGWLGKGEGEEHGICSFILGGIRK